MLLPLRPGRQVRNYHSLLLLPEGRFEKGYA